MSSQEQIKTLKEYLGVITKIGEATEEHQYIYRGQKNKNWKIQSSAMRRLNDARAEPPELLSYIFTGYIHQIIDEIKLRYSKIYKDLTALECMAHLQHNRVATGLIDFTYNPFAALWFACEARETDGKVFVIGTKTSQIKEIKNREKLDQELNYFFNKDTTWHLWQPSIGTSDIDTQRITSQQSVFLFGAPEVPQSFIKKEILISGEHKNNLLRELETMGISEQTLFSDLAGFFERNNVDSVYDKEFAEDFYTSQIEKSKKERDKKALTNNYSQRGIFRSALGKYEGAIEDFDEAIEISPKFAGAYNNRGIAKGRIRQHREAIKDFDKAIKIDPQFAGAYYNRGITKVRLERYEEAIKDFDKAIKIDPQNAKAHYNRGIAKAGLRQYKEAIKDFDKAVEIDPQHTKAYYNRGIAKAELKQYKEAIKDFNKAVGLGPQNAEVYYYRGIVRLLLSEWESAKTDLITAKNHGVNIAELFQEVYRSITEFEKKFNVPLPADVKALLTCKSQD